MMLETEKVDSFSFLPPVDNLETSEKHRYFPFRLPVDNLETSEKHRYFPFRLPVDNLEKRKNSSTFSVSDSEENTYTTYMLFPHDVKGKK